LVWGPSTNWLDDCDDAWCSFNGTILIYFIGIPRVLYQGGGHLYSLHILVYLSGHISFVAHFYSYLCHEEPLFKITLTSFQALAQADGTK
jgi:hypothetical protein